LYDRKMKRRLAIVVLAACSLSAQTKPAFDVATIKPAAPVDQARIAAAIQNGGKWPTGPYIGPERAEFTSMDLKSLITLAYGVRGDQVAGPDWMSATRFDIVAKIPAGVSRAEVPRMMQSLLEARFGLATHRSSVERPIFALVVNKGGPRLKPSGGSPVVIDPDASLKPGEIRMQGPNGPILMTVDQVHNGYTMDYGLRGKLTRSDNPATHSIHMELSMVTMEGLADLVSQVFRPLRGGLSRQIVDMTGIAGNYDATLDASLTDVTATGSDPDGAAPPLNEAIQKLGLRLEPRSAMMEQLVVDHVERMPTEN